MKKDQVLIIAEAGVNHNGDMNMARGLVEAAAVAGADFVKFQTFRADRLVSRNAKKAEYQIRNTGDDDGQYRMLKNLELSESDHEMLVKHCEKNSIRFLSTAFDEESLDLLLQFDPPLIKIPSGEITNRPYLEKISRLGRPVILSTGMSEMNEIREAFSVLLEGGLKREDITILHCNTEYPTPFADVNLRAMLTIGKEFGVRCGYSDHTTGIEISCAAAALGASVIEKHFTLDRNLPGPDHPASLEPAELKRLVSSVRNIEAALGSPEKKPSPSEYKNRDIARKSLHAAADLPAGKIVSPADFLIIRPGDGISPMRLAEISGKKLLKPLKSGEKLTGDHLA